MRFIRFWSSNRINDGCPRGVALSGVCASMEVQGKPSLVMMLGYAN